VFAAFAVASPTGIRKKLLVKSDKYFLSAQKRRGRVAQLFGDAVEQNTDAKVTESLSGSII